MRQKNLFPVVSYGSAGWQKWGKSGMKVRYEVPKMRCEVVKVGQKWGEETAFGVIGMGCKKKLDLF